MSASFGSSKIRVLAQCRQRNSCRTANHVANMLALTTPPCFCASCVRGCPRLHALTAARLFRRCFAKCCVGSAMPPTNTDRPDDTLPTSPESADDRRPEDGQLTHAIRRRLQLLPRLITPSHCLRLPSVPRLS